MIAQGALGSGIRACARVTKSSGQMAACFFVREATETLRLHYATDPTNQEDT